MSVWWRVGLSALALLLWSKLITANEMLAPLVSGPAAGLQFENSDASYMQSHFLMGLFSWTGGVLTLALLVVLTILWYSPVKQLFNPKTLMGFLFLAMVSNPAFAFFEKVDVTEAYTILPNETAFWIPDGGANKTTQVQFDSEQFLQENKVAVKRYVIPHHKLTGSGGTAWFSGWDSYVPDGRLIIVDRTPFSMEWVDDADRGSSSKKEGFHCQSKEGLNIVVGVSVGASVLEQNAAKFLFRYGVNPPPGDRKDPQVIFASVYYGRSLTSVMQDVGRKKIQTLVCGEIAALSLDEANLNMTKIMEKVVAQSTAYFMAYGITLDFLGWADSWSYDPPVQDAINRLYIAKQDLAIATALAPYAETIQRLAVSGAVQKFGEKSDGKLPATLVGLPPSVVDMLNALSNTTKH